MIECRYFEIQAHNYSRAMAFYQKVFHWELINDPEIENSWLLLAPSNNGYDKAIRLREKGFLVQQESDKAFIFTVIVPCLDEFCHSILSSGGFLVIPKTAISEAGWIAYCRDSEGNLFGIIQIREQFAARAEKERESYEEMEQICQPGSSGKNQGSFKEEGDRVFYSR